METNEPATPDNHDGRTCDDYLAIGRTCPLCDQLRAEHQAAILGDEEPVDFSK